MSNFLKENQEMEPENKEEKGSVIIFDAMSKSTLHGLPRFANSTGPGIRILWLLLITGSACLFTVHVSKLIGRYRQHEVITSLNPRGIPFQFPDIVLCQEVPLAQSYYLLAREKNTSAYSDIINKINTLEKLQDQVVNEFKSQQNETLKLNKGLFFWETMDWLHLYNEIGHRIHQTISRTTYNGEEVNVTQNWTMNYQRTHGYCFRLSVDSSSVLGLSESVALSLYLDLAGDSHYQTLLRRLGLNTTFRQGLRLYLSGKGSSPNYETQYINIRPGQFYDIQVKMTQRLFTNSSKRPCYSKVPAFVNPLRPIKISRPSNHYQSCVDEAIQHVMVNNCGCYVLSASNGLAPPEVRAGYPACFNITRHLTGSPDAITLLQARAKCYLHIVKVTHLNISRDCQNHIPCNSTQYSTTWSFGSWPTKEVIDDVYSMNVVEPHAKAREMNLNVPGWETIIKKKDLISAGYADIVIRPHEVFSAQIKEFEAYPFYNLLSDIGGVMGVYMGMSILTISEVIELVIRLLDYFCNKPLDHQKVN